MASHTKTVIKCNVCWAYLRVPADKKGKVRCPSCSSLFEADTTRAARSPAAPAASTTGEDLIFLDTETTGLHPPEDKIVEIAIVDGKGKILLDTLVNPERPIGFATSIHGIEDRMVSSCSTIDQLLPAVIEAVRGKHVVIYNAKFDTRFFPSGLSEARKISCAMLQFAEFRGEVNPRFGSFRWHKLTVAADHIGYTWEGTAHRALADTLATRAVWSWLKQNT